MKKFVLKSGEILLYKGNPNFDKLEDLSKGSGDIWHSSFEQGYKNAFPELVYQTAVFFWYLNDFDDLDKCISWRINPNHFVVREEVWKTMNGFDTEYTNSQMQALDFGYNALRVSGAVPLYSKGLFDVNVKEEIKISTKDRYVFFRKNFKIDHSLYMIFREGFWKYSEWNSFFYAKKKFKQTVLKPIVQHRQLKQIEGNPTVSYIIPTMMRQDFTLQLLDDLTNQSYLVTQVVIVDATPENQRNESLYKAKKYPFELILKWQTTKGSCRARNEAIQFCTGDYLVFGDDDIRVPSNYIENHLRFLQTYNAGACNGLDIRADHQKQDLHDLQKKLDNYGNNRFLTGATQLFNNANNCVKREFVNQLIGNDVNFDGGYGEDNDFGMSLAKIGVIVLQNPFSTNLHLKPASGGYRFWGAQSKILGKKRKTQPWELDTPVKSIIPVPSPTVMYGIIKHYRPEQLMEYKYKHFIFYLRNGSKVGLMYRFLRIPYKNLQFKKSIFYAQKLINLGIRHQ
jgi:glycosyltransferase involved in cell wall biosynthesis